MPTKQHTIVFNGGFTKDERGTVRYVNDFSLRGIKRFYQVENTDLSIIRAFHGHMEEAKYVYVALGKILLCVVPIDDVKRPSKNAKVNRFILSSEKPQVVYIPPSYANGFKTLEKNSIVLFFSTSTLSESLKDDFRFSSNYWGEDIWQVNK